MDFPFQSASIASRAYSKQWDNSEHKAAAAFWIANDISVYLYIYFFSTILWDYWDKYHKFSPHSMLWKQVFNYTMKMENENVFWSNFIC